MRKANPKNAEKQRKAIIRGALKCFVRKGVHGTSTDDICRAAKVSSGTLYYYFKSRDGLMRDLIVHAHSARDHLLRDLPDAPDLLEALVDVQTASAEAIKAQGIPIEVYIELLAYSTRNAAAKAAFRDAAVQVTAIVAQAVHANQLAGKLRSDISADALARFISAAVTGMSIAAISQGIGTQQDFRETLAILMCADGAPTEDATQA